MNIKTIIALAIFSISCNCTQHNQNENQLSNQLNSVTEKGWITSKREFAGIVMIDENGKKTRSSWVSNFIYFSLPDTATYQFNSLRFNGVKYEIANVPNVNEEVLVGVAKNTNESIAIKPQAGKKIYQYKIINFPDTTISEKIKFIVQGKLNNKNIKLKFNEKIVELEPELRP